MKRLNGLPRYLMASAKAIYHLQSYELQVRMDDLEMNGSFLFLSIGNGKYSGGGFKLTPDARVNDGFLDVCLVDKTSHIKTIYNLPLTLLGKHGKLSFVRIIQAKKIMIKSSTKLPVYMDGELPDLKNKKELSIAVIPQCLNFIVP